MQRCPDDLDKIAAAQSDFEKFFGRSESTHATISELGGEQVIIVENHIKRAFYSMNVELLKIINLTGTEE